MTTSGLSVPARRRALAPLRGFCGWLVRSRRLPIDPTQDEDLTVRGGAQALPVSFTDDGAGTHHRSGGPGRKHPP